jgi:peptidoglycan hydrolase-like protein with peptidoglycan-binding domain
MIDELKAKIQGFAAAYKAIKTGAPVAASTKISDSVGEGGKNIAADVKLVQELLNKNHGQSLTADGDCGAKTIAAIKDFQAKKAGLSTPDGRIDPGGQTWTALSTGKAVAAATTKDGKPTTPAKEQPAPSGKYYSHPKASQVNLNKGARAVPLNAPAEQLLRSLLAGSGNMSATYTSTLRTYVDQARAMFGNVPSQIDEWYGRNAPKVPAAFRQYKAKGDQAGFAKWLEAYDKERGRQISNHLPGLAIDVININHKAFQNFSRGKAGVKLLLDEPKIGVTHIEFIFKVTGGSASAGGGGSTELPADSTAPVSATAPVSGAISQSVGEGGKNVEADVKLVQQLLNKNHGQSLTADGDCGAKTIAAIKDFQAKKAGLSNPDGRIDPGGKTWIALSTGKFVAPVPPINNGQNNVEPGDLKGEYAKIAAQYGLEQAVVYTIQKVESGGKGYLADGRAKILFEGHVFWRELVAIGKDPEALLEGNENILYKKWVSTHYVGGAGEYDRLAKAQKIDSSAALKSASWGEFQIMGNNHKSVGYSTVEEFVEAMKVPGTNNVKALMEFCKNNNLLRFVTGPNKRWAKFAEGYNGPGYKKNKYDEKLAAAYEEFKKQYPEPAPPMA